MPIRHLLPGAALAAALLAPSAAVGADYSRERVIVGYESGTSAEVAVDDGDTVRETLQELRRDPDVDYAVPDYKLHKAQVAAPEIPPFVPNDPGRGGGWRELQWNFAGPFGVNAPQAWAYARAADVDGGRGVVVAVIDSGVAYRDRGRFRRAPDLYAGRFTKPYDFIDEDRIPLDEDGHGTHVAGTIAQKTNNNLAVTGLAYGVTIMPIRILDESGEGDGSDFTRALRYAARNGADVINMSVEFPSELRRADIPEVIEAMRYARRKGALLVGASGNDGEDHVSYPARSGHAISTGASTHGGCLAAYSNIGSGLDVVAPGGGEDAPAGDSDWDREHCDPSRRGRVIYQQTFWRNVRDFRIVGFEGTSEAAAHVTATAALVIATDSAGENPSPAAVLKRIQETARDLGAPGYDARYGYGLVDAAAAIRPPTNPTSG
jgi:serine protease